MRQWQLIPAVLLILFGQTVRPFPPVDSGDLYLVETLLVERGKDGVTLWAEGIPGTGADVAEALSALEENVPGELFLRQTRRVIFCGGMPVQDPWELPEELPVGACVYRWPGPAEELEPETLNALLDARERRHSDTPDLAGLQNSMLSEDAPVMELLELEVPRGTA